MRGVYDAGCALDYVQNEVDHDDEESELEVAHDLAHHAEGEDEGRPEQQYEN